VQLLNKNADKSARLTVLLKAASELKHTVALFHTFTILFAKKFASFRVCCDCEHPQLILRRNSLLANIRTSISTPSVQEETQNFLVAKFYGITNH